MPHATLFAAPPRQRHAHKNSKPPHLFSMGVEAFCLPRAHFGAYSSPKKQPPERDGFSGITEGSGSVRFFKDEGGIKKSRIKPKAGGKSERLFQVCKVISLPLKICCLQPKVARTAAARR